MTNCHCDRAAQALRLVYGQKPGKHGAPVVADHINLLDTQVIEQGHVIGNHTRPVMVSLALGDVRLAVPTHVRRQQTVARGM